MLNFFLVLLSLTFNTFEGIFKYHLSHVESSCSSHLPSENANDSFEIELEDYEEVYQNSDFLSKFLSPSYSKNLSYFVESTSETIHFPFLIEYPPQFF